MTFLTWDNQSDADTSLAAVNTVYNCPIQNGYTMTTWAVVTKSEADEKWGFDKPKPINGKTTEQLEDALVVGYTELAEKPANWITEENVMSRGRPSKKATEKETKCFGAKRKSTNKEF